MLEDFWMSIKEGGGGGLEVSVDCSESVLAAIVHYIPTGTLLPFQVSSMPELAMTLLRYQQEHIDDPDFDIDDIDETKLPLMGEDMSTSLLELCRIASELKMTELEELATRRFVQLCYDSFFAIESRGDDAYDSLEELEMAKVFICCCYYVVIVIVVVESYLNFFTGCFYEACFAIVREVGTSVIASR